MPRPFHPPGIPCRARPTRRAYQARQAVPHRRPHRPRRQTEGRRPRHHRPRHRRAGLRHARAHCRRRRGRDPQRLHALHRGRGHPGAQGRDHRQVQARQRHHLHAPADPGLDRREADDLQPVHGGDRSGRRGHDPGAVLGLVPGHGAARRRRAGHALRRPRTGLQDHARPARSGDHAEDPGVHAEQPEQPDRRGLHARRTRRRSARCCASTRGGHRHRRHVRAHLLGAGAVLQLPDRLPRPLRPHGDDQRRVQELCHDGLAHRLLRRSGGDRHGDVDHPEPEHLEPVLHRAEGGRRGARTATRRASAK